MPCPECGYDFTGNDCFACGYMLEVIPKEKKIKKATVDRAAETREYNKQVKIFLAKNPRCAVYPELPSTQVHHKKGRTGKYLLDQRYWLAVSDKGHDKIHNYHNWALEKGFKILRSV